MRRLTPTELRIAEEFLAKLKTFNYNIMAKELENIQIQGQLVSKTDCLKLLRTFPGLEGEQFKDDRYLVNYLRKETNLKYVLGGLESEQGLEIEEILKRVVQEQPIQAETSVEQTQQAVEQPVPSGTTQASSGGLPFGMPSGSSISSVIHPAPRVQPPTPLTGGREGGTGEGTAATRKINKQANLTSASPDKVSTPVDNLSTAEKQPVKGIKGGSATRFNFPAFRSKVGSGIANAGNRWLEKANPLIKKAGNGLVRSLSSIANPGGMGGGAGSRSVFGRFSRFSRGGGGSAMTAAKKRGGLIFALGILLFAFLVGGIATFGPSPTPGSAAPVVPTTPSEISSCKFTRAGNPQQIKSSILTSWISNAAVLAGISPQVLASVAMHESQEFTANADNNHDGIKSGQLCNKGKLICINKENTDVLHPKDDEDNPCAPEDIAGGAKTAQAVGLMQNLDIYNPGKDLCSIAENLNLAATKLKNSGLTQNPTQEQVKKAIQDYHNSCKYGSYDYCGEVWQDIQNCQTTAGSTLPPPVSGDYKGWVKSNFNIDISQLPDSYPQWAYEILNASIAIAPKFQGLIKAKPTAVVPVSSGSYTSGDTINIKTGYDANFFKQIFIHELGHRIKGPAGVVSPACNGQTLEQAASEGYITYYAEHATPANIKSPACETDDPATKNDQNTRSDEDFAESVSYYINNTMPELNYGSGCSMYDGSVNPYSRSTEPRPAHKAYIQCLLGP